MPPWSCQVDTRLPRELLLPLRGPLRIAPLAPAAVVRSQAARITRRAGSPPASTGRMPNCRTARDKPASSLHLAGWPDDAQKAPACSLPASALDASTGGPVACSSTRLHSS